MTVRCSWEKEQSIAVITGKVIITHASVGIILELPRKNLGILTV
jgi:hypothetical protein